MSQPVGAHIEPVGGDQNDEDIEVEQRAKGAPLADIVLEDVEHLEALPEKEQGDEHEPVGGIEPAIGAERPGDAAEKHHGREGQEQREAVDFLLRLGGGLAFLLPGAAFFQLRLGAETQAPEEGGQTEDERQVGDVVDQAVGQHFLGGAVAAGDDRDEEQVA